MADVDPITLEVVKNALASPTVFDPQYGLAPGAASSSVLSASRMFETHSVRALRRPGLPRGSRARSWSRP